MKCDGRISLFFENISILNINKIRHKPPAANMSNIFTGRINCWVDTQKIAATIQEPPPATKIQYDPGYSALKTCAKSEIKFFDMDSIDCALAHAPDAVILNLADDNFPGGCVALGASAQEEAIFRRTNYCSSLKIPQPNNNLYPIRDGEAVYSPEISVIKTSEADGWQLIPAANRPKVAFIACPGLKYPYTKLVDGEPRLTPIDVERLKNKIRVIIQTAAKFGHQTIILGAVGCGAWRNPIKHVAEVFAELLLGEYNGVIPNYYFAILTTDDRNSIMRNRGNSSRRTIDIFRDVFSLVRD
jgi:uncharacterized protein (TIGR02452 family)